MFTKLHFRTIPDDFTSASSIDQGTERRWMVQGSKQDKVRKGQNRPCLPLPQVDPGRQGIEEEGRGH